MALLIAAGSKQALARVAAGCSGRLLTPQEILNCLNPPAHTRSLRGISVEGPGKPAPPAVNMMINFAFDSAALTTDGIIQLRSLGQALTNPVLQDARFEIAGYTDAVGTVAYNQALSERRADAVRDYLVEHFGLDPLRLRAAGFGKTDFFDPADPTSSVNRRVQITRTRQEASQ